MALAALSHMPRRLIRRVSRLRVPAVAREVQRRHLTYLTDAKFLSLRDAIREVRRRNVPGDFLEYGIAMGGSAVYLASETGVRRFRGYDVFGMIPSPGERDDELSKERYEVIRSGRSKGIGGDRYYGYAENLFGRVCETFASFGYPVDGVKVALHQGLFEDTVRFAPGDRVALAHIDCDWYDPVSLCLERTADVLHRDGLLILDDYNDYGGCRKAADEFLVADPRFELVRTSPHAVLRKN
jgi:asparagine synthase (glutamine-hydrolysing)